MQITKVDDLITPEVMADAISAKLDKKLALLPYVHVDNKLKGQPGATITVPKYGYIGDAVDVPEGEEIPTRKLTMAAESYTIKKAALGGVLTDESVLCGYGDPVGNFAAQLALSISAKVDNDSLEAAYGAKTSFVAKTHLTYNAIVDSVDLFEDETETEKVIFIHPKQLTQLRKDPDFISKDKYGNDVMTTGEVGMIAGCRVKASRKVKKFDEWYSIDGSGSLTIVASGGNDSTEVDLSKVLPSIPTAKVGDKVTKHTDAVYFNPIIKLDDDKETGDDTSALTVFLKQDTNVEKQRQAGIASTEIYGTKHYCAALTNESRVVVAKVLAEPKLSEV